MPHLGREVDVDAFWRDGFTIVRNVYSPEEVEELRQACRAGGGASSGDLLARPNLRRVLTDGVMIEIAQKVLGRDDIVYAGDSSFTINSTGRGWHKDNADRVDPNAPDWRSPYTQLRFGIYLQDHKFHSGGLNVRVGSHNKPTNQEGKIVSVRSGIGDVGVWSMRITHSANSDLLRFPPFGSTDPATAETAPPKPWKLFPKNDERIAVFAALGLDDDHGRRYTDYLKTRTYMVNLWRNGPYTPEAIAEAEAAGLTVRDIPAEVKDDATAGQNAEWAPIPY
ncbi:hypothetical protein HJ588_09385 [Flexivirga sp. ID2601S]|uniref:Phytanoyl-CoA dioxygenase n=1 Tax=Flexivirga aerilata TaxID=1656889 RepID=A0A849AHS4_9MICO|nr:hypothetical protein [Flexivirga aerilata]NNG39483.1 hypothetical protein [Flexivirga aerilata]